MKKVLIAHRGENGGAAAVSPHRRACAAGDGDLAAPRAAVSSMRS
ncbi:hypothetical protein [Acidovorax sp. NCPPB 4044]|nr:hypothetical protein [Acidovorax sp. NCPPB 4044]